MSTRQLFSNRLTTVITMIGISVGLGNVWRFPYMMGEYGGSAFLLIYLLFTLMFAVPAVMGEWALGRGTRQASIGAFSAAFGKKIGLIIGCMLLFTVMIAESYYLYVIANLGFATFFSATTGFSQEAIPIFKNQLDNSLLQYSICVVILFSSYFVLVRGLKNGIESLSNLIVPFFMVVMIFLIIFVFQLENSAQYLAAYLQPDFSALQPVHIFAALGQAFFSLGLGGTFLVVFGSYIKAEENLSKSAAFTAFGDLSAALMAGLFIVPTVLILGLDMSQGPGLLFATLPELFQRLPYGQIVGTLFLFALFTVTFISSIAALEVLLSGIDDALGGRITRSKLVIVICLVESLLVMGIAFDPSVIGLLDLVFGSGMQVLGSMLALLALTWGLGKTNALDAVFGSVRKKWHSFYFYWIQWVVPLVLLSVLIGYIISKF